MKTLAFLALFGCAAPLSRRDWTIQGALATASLVDALETRQIVRAGAEENPLVGHSGERLPYPVAGALMLGAELLVTGMLSGDWRLGFESWALGAESCVVSWNILRGWYPW